MNDETNRHNPVDHTTAFLIAVPGVILIAGALIYLFTGQLPSEWLASLTDWLTSRLSA